VLCYKKPGTHQVKSPKAAKLVRIYMCKNDRSGGKSLYVALTHFLKERDISRVIVLRGRIGFGRGGIIHGNHFWSIPGDFPIILECLDQAERIEAVLPEIGQLLIRRRYKFIEEIFRFLGLNISPRRMLTRGKCVVIDGQVWG